MNHKIVDVLPLMVAMLLVAFLAVGDNPATAAAPISADQSVTVTVNPNIAISTPSSITLPATNAGQTAQSSTYDVSNVGNVPVYIYVKANSASFAGDNDTIPIDPNYQIRIQDGSTFTTLTTSLQQITTTKLKTANQAGSTGADKLTTLQKLAIPSGTEAATYTNSLTYSALSPIP